jgi:5-oxoprolinase (ATP-hydrolysing)
MLNKSTWFDFSIDRGGTFTDIFCQVTNSSTNEQETVVMKLLSVDPANYQDAPTEGIRRILNDKGLSGETALDRADKIPTQQIKSIRMGTTVATNALLERKGDRVALLITKGLRDALKIGN